MKIIEIAGRKLIDQELRDYISKIWDSYDMEIPDDNNIYFAKNTTVHRLMSDYNSSKDLRRVIKKEKANYVILKKTAVSDYPQYYNASTSAFTDNVNDEVVYGIYNLRSEDQETIELICYYANNPQLNVKFVNNDKFNESFNNGVVINNENYTMFKELVDSDSDDNRKLAANMIINSDLKQNWQWLLYIYHDNSGALTMFDIKNVIKNYFSSKNMNFNNSCNNIDITLSLLTDEDVKLKMIQFVNSKVNDKFNDFLRNEIGTEKFDLKDFKIQYNGTN